MLNAECKCGELLLYDTAFEENGKGTIVGEADEIIEFI